MSPPKRVRPRLRGASHRVAFRVAPLAGLALLVMAMGRGPSAVATSVVYAISLVALFGISATYHRCPGPPERKLRWQRADHAAIFVLIAGTYTPLCVLGVGGATGLEMLALIWIGAALGVVRATLWDDAPRGIAAALYVVLGWLMVAYFGDVRAGLGDPLLILLLLGGGLYTVGALIYALQRPDPMPTVFGYHEVFHVLVIAAAGCHFALILALVRAA